MKCVNVLEVFSGTLSPLYRVAVYEAVSITVWREDTSTGWAWYRLNGDPFSYPTREEAVEIALTLSLPYRPHVRPGDPLEDSDLLQLMLEEVK